MVHADDCVRRGGGRSYRQGVGAGYSNAQGTLGRCCFFGAAATLFAFPAAFTDNMWVIQGSLWWLLFFGGALLSPATGVCINAVSPELRWVPCVPLFCILGYLRCPSMYMMYVPDPAHTSILDS
jgi:hypothetical protein